MGYRSNVVIAFKKDAFDKYAGKTKENFKDCDLIEQDDKTVIFTWESVKWYDDYPDVQSITQLMSTINDKCKEAVGFVRVGEDTKDIVTYGDPYYFNVFPETLITTPSYVDQVEHDKFFACNSIKLIKEE